MKWKFYILWIFKSFNCNWGVCKCKVYNCKLFNCNWGVCTCKVSEKFSDSSNLNVYKCKQLKSLQMQTVEKFTNANNWKVCKCKQLKSLQMQTIELFAENVRANRACIPLRSHCLWGAHTQGDYIYIVNNTVWVES